MSIYLSSLVWNETKTVGTTRLLLLALAEMAKDDGICWPSIETLAKRVNVKSERSIQKQLAELEALGYLRREMRKGHSTKYHVFIPDPRRAERGVCGDGVSVETPYPRLTGHPTPVPGDTQNRNGTVTGTITSSSPMSSDTTTQRASTTDASKTNALSEAPKLRTSPYGAEEEAKSVGGSNLTTRRFEPSAKHKPSTHSQQDRLTVRSASHDTTDQAQQSSKAHNTQNNVARRSSEGSNLHSSQLEVLSSDKPSDKLSDANASLRSASSDCQTIARSPVEPTLDTTEQILSAYYQARFNEPCRSRYELAKARAYAQALSEAGYTPAQVIQATKHALAKWSSPSNVTLKAISQNITALLQATAELPSSATQVTAQTVERGTATRYVRRETIKSKTALEQAEEAAEMQELLALGAELKATSKHRVQRPRFYG